LVKRIEELVEEFNGYGYRRITVQLRREGIRVNHKRVLRLMPERGLIRKPKRRWVRTTDSTHGYKIYLNRLPESSVTALNQVEIAEITYIRIRVGFVYLAIILDPFFWKAIGYALPRNIDTQLSLRALHMFLQSPNPLPWIIHHSDQGVQYADREYMDTLHFHGFRISMARRGNPYDNAVAESFLKTLKTEEGYLWEYETLADVEKRVPYFIEKVYNSVVR
jgi:transposase InsO family protein